MVMLITMKKNLYITLSADNLQFKAVTAEDENILCDFKRFRTRLPNLLNCYKEAIALS
jgi:hypothetical protein